MSSEQEDSEEQVLFLKSQLKERNLECQAFEEHARELETTMKAMAKSHLEEVVALKQGSERTQQHDPLHHDTSTSITASSAATHERYGELVAELRLMYDRCVGPQQLQSDLQSSGNIVKHATPQLALFDPLNALRRLADYISDLQQASSNLRHDKESSSLQVSSLRNQMNIRISHWQEEAKSLQMQVAVLKQELKESKEKNETEEAVNTNQLAVIDSMEHQLAVMQTQSFKEKQFHEANKAQLENDIENLKAMQQDTSTNQKGKEELSSLQAEIAELKKYISSLEQKLSYITEQKEEITKVSQSRVNDLTKEQKTLMSRLPQYVDLVSSLTEQLAALQQSSFDSQKSHENIVKQLRNELSQITLERDDLLRRCAQYTQSSHGAKDLDASDVVEYDLDLGDEKQSLLNDDNDITGDSQYLLQNSSYSSSSSPVLSPIMSLTDHARKAIELEQELANMIG